MAENAELRCRVVELAADNAVQAKVIGELRRNVTELEKRLSKDSTNSSMPVCHER